MSLNEGSGWDSECSLLLHLEEVLTSFEDGGRRTVRGEVLSSIYEIARNTAVRIHALDVECESLRR